VKNPVFFSALIPGQWLVKAASRQLRLLAYCK
jgi:hypothetical protein